jgi:hypothetical protein
MSWIQLFKVNSFEQALAKRKKRVFHVDPILKGRPLRHVIKVFNMVDMPFVWKEKCILRENNRNSPYHKFPRGVQKRESKYIERVLKLRQGIITAKEKELKWRQEYLQKRPLKGIDLFIKSVMPYFIKQSPLLMQESGEKRKRKAVSEFVKDVPKLKSPEFNRREQEKYKVMVINEVVGPDTLTNSKKAMDKKREAAKKLAKKEETSKSSAKKVETAGDTVKAQKAKKGDKTDTEEETSDDES